MEWDSVLIAQIINAGMVLFLTGFAVGIIVKMLFYRGY